MWWLKNTRRLGPSDLRRQRVVEIAVDFDQVFQPAGLAVEGDFFQRDSAGDRLADIGNFGGVDVDGLHA